MPVSILDLVVIGIVLISGLLAMVRGFTREVLAIGFLGGCGDCRLSRLPQGRADGDAIHRQAAPGAGEWPCAGRGLPGLAVRGLYHHLETVGFHPGQPGRCSGSNLGLPLWRRPWFPAGGHRLWLLPLLVGDKQQPSWVAEAKFRPILVTSFDRLKSMLPENLDESIGTVKQLTDELKTQTPAPRQP